MDMEKNGSAGAPPQSVGAWPTSDVNKDWTCKDKDKDKDQVYKDQDKTKD